MNIKTKLLAGYLIVATSSLIVGYLGGMTTNQVKLAFKEVVEETIPVIEAIENIRAGGMRLVSSTSEFGFIKAEKRAAEAKGQISEEDDDDEKEEEEFIKKGSNLLQSSLKQYAALVNQFFPGEQELLKDITNAAEALQISSKQLIERKNQGKEGREILELKEQFEELEQGFLKSIEKALEHKNEELKDRSELVNYIINAGNKTVFITSGLIFLLAIIIGFFISRSISKPIIDLKEATKNIGEGQLDTRIEINTKDEIGDLATSFNKMAEELAAAASLTVAKAYVDNILRSMINTLVVINPDATIRTVNKATLELLGYEEKELIGKNIGSIIAREEEEEEALTIVREQGIEVLIQQGSVHNQELRYLTKDRRKVSMLFSGSVLHGDDGNIHGIVCVAQDITGRKQVEQKERELVTAAATAAEATKRSEELARANQELKSTQSQLIQSGKLASLGELATGIAHEINQPLTYISTHVQVLELDIMKEKAGQAEVLATLKAFKERIKRISAIIIHLRSFGRDQDKDFVSVNLNEVLNNTLLLLRERMRLKNVEFHLELKPDLPPFKGNPYQLEQVFINLIQNSIDILAEKNGGNITVKAVHLAKQQQIEITFSDDGPGIPFNARERIFDPFYTTKPEGQGTGLGLSISHGIIQAHHGKIICHSQPSQGATFIITFPVGQTR